MAKESNTEKRLTAKEELFCQEWLIDRNGTQAAIRAGYSERSAREYAHELLHKPHIQARLETLQKALFLRLGISVERVYQELGRIAFFDIRKAFDENGMLKKIQDMDDETAAAINSIEVDELFDFKDGERQRVGETKKVKTNNKISSLQLLVTMLGGPTANVDITSKGKSVDMPSTVKVTMNI